MRLNSWMVGCRLACLAAGLSWPGSLLANPFEALLLSDGFPEADVRLQEPHAGIKGLRIRVNARPDDAPENGYRAVALEVMDRRGSSFSELSSVSLADFEVQGPGQRRTARHRFWRDASGRWHVFEGKLEAEIEARLARSVELSDPERAWMHRLLGMLEQARGHQQTSTGRPVGLRKAAVAHFEMAADLIERGGSDPQNLLPGILGPLDKASARAGQADSFDRRLQRLALVLNPPGESPVPMVKYAPSFPRAAAVRDVQGWALLAFTVNASGRVEAVRVVEEHPQGEGFGAAAIAAAEQYLYLPRHVNGVFLPTPGISNLVTFEIDGVRSP